MADRVHPIPMPAAATTETTPLQQQHPSFNRPLSPPPGTYIVQIPKDQVLRVPPPDRARRYKKLAARPARRRLLRRACCCTCLAVLLILLLAAAFAGAVYLVFRPRAPTFSVASLSIRGLDNLTNSSSLSTNNIDIDAAVRADNGWNKKVGIDYRGGGSVTVSYAGERLASGPWPAFRQPPRNVTVFAVAMRNPQGVRLTEEQIKQLAAEQAAGAVPMKVEAVVPVRLRFGGTLLRTWTVDVKATCDVAVNKLAANATAVNRGCKGQGQAALVVVVIAALAGGALVSCVHMVNDAELKRLVINYYSNGALLAGRLLLPVYDLWSYFVDKNIENFLGV